MKTDFQASTKQNPKHVFALHKDKVLDPEKYKVINW